MTLPAVSLLIRAGVRRLWRRRVRAGVVHFVVPGSALWFAAFIGVDVADPGWAATGHAAAVCLLFVFSLTEAGLSAHRERRLLNAVAVHPWMVVATSAVVPAGVFVLQLLLLRGAAAVDRSGGDVDDPRLFAASILALAAGLGCGMLAGRVSAARPGFDNTIVRLSPLVLVVSPVLFDVSRLGRIASTWCSLNPICAPTAIASAAATSAATPLDRSTVAVSAALAVALFIGGLWSTRRPADRRITGTHLEMHAVSVPGRADAPPILAEVDLSVGRGEIVAVIGASSTAKTALLEVAAGRPIPFEGAVAVPPVVDRLINPRHGFHAELTGRENAMLRYLSQGCDVEDSERRASKAAEFSGLGRAIDRRAGTYSKRELARASFAAMAFGDASLLLWDDVLERVDPTYRQKCLAFIPTLLSEGRSILMVSRRAGKLPEISARAIVIEDGRVRFDGSAAAALRAHIVPAVRITGAARPSPDGGPVEIASVALTDLAGRPLDKVAPGDPITVVIDLDASREVEAPYFLISLASEFGPVTEANTFLDGAGPPSITGRFRISCTFDRIVLAPRHTFTVRFALYRNDGMTVLQPKQTIAEFVTDGSAAASGFHSELAEGRIARSAPILSSYEWHFGSSPPGENG